MTSPSNVIRFKKVRETKNKVRLDEVGGDVIGPLYVKKSVFADKVEDDGVTLFVTIGRTT